MFIILVAAFVITLAIAFSDFLGVMLVIAGILWAGVWLRGAIHAATWPDFLSFLEGCGILAGMFALAWVVLTLAERYSKKPIIESPAQPHSTLPGSPASR